MMKGLYKHDADARLKISLGKTGKPAWNKGRPFSPETRKRMSDSAKGKTFSDEHLKKLSIASSKPRPWQKNRNTPESRLKISQALKGEKSHLWRGGLTPINAAIRHSIEYKLWRDAVFKRDNYTCVFCGTKKSPFNADHIKQFALYPELRFAIDNGRTLCVPCHKTTDTYMKK